MNRFEVLVRVSQAAGLETTIVTECVERRILPEPGAAPEQELVEQACRVRRLRELGVNIQGIEVITHMRSRVRHARREARSLRDELEQVRREHERRIAQLLREMSETPEGR